MNTDRLIELGKVIWNSLTEEEQGMFCIVEGSYTLVEMVVSLLTVPDFDWDDINLIETIHNGIIGSENDEDDID